MNKKIENIISNALKILSYDQVKFNVEKTRSIQFGDYSSNVAMILTKTPIGKTKNPMLIAEEIVSHIDKQLFRKVEIVHPGFINFYLSLSSHKSLLDEIHEQNNQYPCFPNTNLKYNIEYVSANPTGYLHLGHARNAVFGDCLARILRKVNIGILTEYYVNDAGNQMSILASSVLVRYKQLFHINIELPSDSYHGEEIKDVALNLKEKFSDQFINVDINEHFVISDIKIREQILIFSRDYLLNQIKLDLGSLGVYIDLYYSELTTYKNNLISKTLDLLSNNIYTKDNAIWLSTSKFGDDKDRVLIKSDKSPTYYMADIAYHNVKLNRKEKIDKLIDVWGSDHYGHITRTKIGLKLSGEYNNEIIDIVCLQMVKLLKDKKEFKMSKRSGKSITLRNLVDAIGRDASRWFLISSSPNTQVEIDIDVALKKDNNNPLYYVEYAYARCCSILNKTNFNYMIDDESINLLTNHDYGLLSILHNFKSIIYTSANNYEPHRLANYIYNLAKHFHSYYECVKIIDETNSKLTNLRLSLVSSTKIILANGLNLLGIDAYEKM